MAYLNIIGSIFYSIFGYISFYHTKYFFEIMNHHYLVIYITLIMTIILYLFSQGLAVTFRKSGHTLAFMLDIIFSLIPLFIVMLSFQNHHFPSDYMTYYRIAYLLAVLVDLFIFVPICFKLSKYGVHTNQ